MQILSGPRQVGKTTLVTQVTKRLKAPVHYVSADEPTLRGPAWLATQWNTAQQLALQDGQALLVIDEVQKVPDWAEQVKRLWDEDTRRGIPLKVVLLGSSPLLVHRGTQESLAGRFETIHMPHWSYPEMRTAFDCTLDDYILFGGYPGAAHLREDPERWRRYILDSLVETTISRDVLAMARVDKPALLRQLFHLVCAYSGQILSYNKMLGQLNDAGNTTTLAHYLHLLAAAGMAVGLSKYSGSHARQRASTPKLQVLNTALITATQHHDPEAAKQDSTTWGRLVENTVGAHLANASRYGETQTYYWRERDLEVDYVVQHGRRAVAIEVKSGTRPADAHGLGAFQSRHKTHRAIIVGGDGMDLEDFLSTDPADLAL